MKLWVLVYQINDLEIFITPDNAHTNNVKDALKFQTEQAAQSHLYAFNSFLSFKPLQTQIDFKE